MADLANYIEPDHGDDDGQVESRTVYRCTLAVMETSMTWREATVDISEDDIHNAEYGVDGGMIQETAEEEYLAQLEQGGYRHMVHGCYLLSYEVVETEDEEEDDDSD